MNYVFLKAQRKYFFPVLFCIIRNFLEIFLFLRNETIFLLSL